MIKPNGIFPQIRRKLLTENYYLQVNDLNKNFGGISALSGINIEINNNDFIGLIGPNGSGKTTLINQYRNIPASKGNIFFDGENITNYNSIKCTNWAYAVLFKTLDLLMILINREYSTRYYFFNKKIN